MKGVGAGSGEECPVDHKNMTQEQIEAWMAAAKEREGRGEKLGGGETECTREVEEGKPAREPSCGCPQADQGLDLSKPDAEMKEGQRVPLDTTPVPSNIPKGGTDHTWVYPSPQRFYNAMKKKGWRPREEDVPTVVSIHNTVNEMVWRKILEYEQFHFQVCPNPSLLKFRGRPGDFTPKSRLFSYIGYSLPFDRHDWVVDRCGRHVEYVIDFYEGAGGGREGISMYLDARPKLSAGGIVDRIRWQIWNYQRTHPHSPPPQSPPPSSS
mmetsp:Transcript_20160/g.56709  ORF Transcript_20160/g.56709 Transcript_20160/m.56709 type:complete len:267 (+) Transcript_20160:1-801(+)